MAGCVRQAWLVLGGLSVPLESWAGGWFCANLDLGYPEVREVLNNRPDTDGAVDRTALMGARVVNAEIKAEAGAGGRIDAIAAQFAPFMVPSARPVLHYILDRPGTPERTLTLRAAGYGWPVQGAVERDIQLQWKAADPIIRDPTVQTATAMAGAAAGSGRTYPLLYSRTYPVGGGAPSTATITSPGDVPVRPLLNIYGPVSGPVVTFTPTVGPVSRVQFVPAFRLDAGNYVQVDTTAKTAYLNGPGGASELAWLDWFNTAWPVLPTLPASTTMGMAGGSTTGQTQVQAVWQDGYLT
jgi:hypothetical protein